MPSSFIPPDFSFDKYRNKHGELRETSALKFYLGLFSKPKGLGILTFIGICCGNFFSWIFPRLIVVKLLAQLGNKNANVNELYLLGLYIGLSMLFGELLNRLISWFHWFNKAKKLNALFTFSFNKLLNQSTEFFSNNFIGSIVTKVNNFEGGYDQFDTTIIWGFSNVVIEILFASIIIGFKAPIMFIFLVLMFTIFYFSTKKAFRLKSKASYDTNLEYTKLTGILADDLTNYLAIKSFAGEELETKRYKKQLDVYNKKLLKYGQFYSTNVSLRITPLTSMLFGIGVVLSVYAKFKLGIATEIVFLTFTSFNAIAFRFWGLKEIYETLEKALSKTAETMELLDEPIKIIDSNNAKKLSNVKGEIVFKNVNFGYVKEKNIFDNFNLEIKPGERIGLVGPSGGGKSTLSKLILRFEDTTNGKILIDGNPIKEITQNSLRKNISYIPQEPVLFHRTIKENIVYGLEIVDEEEFNKIIEITKISDFVNDLPNGFNTLVGERGVKLSGGQKQRIAIARAMLKNSKIILLDEATSALDSSSEKIIQDALHVAMENKTVIAIAHRLSTIAHLDRILVLDDGKIVEEGTHKQLSKSKGLYQKLWNHQSGGYLGEN